MMDLERQWQAVLMIVALIMSRMLVAFSVIPLFVGNGVPAFIRVVFVGGLSLALLPLALSDEALATLPLISAPIYIAKEAAIGLVLGLLASVGFWALYAAGAIIEYQAGMAFATTIDPLTGQDESLLGSLLVRLFTTLFLITGGLLSLLSLLFDSYVAWPLSSLMPVVDNPRLVTIMLQGLAQLLTTALTVAAPFVIMMLLIEVAFGMLSRFAPLLNVFFVVLPLKVLALALMLLLYGMVVANSGSLIPLTDFTHLLDSLRATWSDAR
jgi:type III secretion protein T